MSNSYRVPAKQWVATGTDYVVDGLWTKFGFQEQFGATRLSGSANGLAVHDDEATGKVYVYSGASNGGVHLRVYDRTNDLWDNSWSWQSRPGTGYEGSQAIAVLAISDDGQYIAAAQGNPTNYKYVAPPSGGVQIGRIGSNGVITWLPVSAEVSSQIYNYNFRSLHWQGSKLIGTTWDGSKGTEQGALVTLEASNDGISAATVESLADTNLILDSNQAGLLSAGYALKDRSNTVRFNGALLSGSKYNSLIAGLHEQGVNIARVSLYPELVNGRVIAFLGSYQPGSDPIARIDRLEIEPTSRTLVDLRTYNVPSGVIGTGQASNEEYYGNFSFKADPYDPQAMAVFSGGNYPANSSISPTPTYTGGLVRVDFRVPDPKPSLFYGLRYTADSVQKPFSPGAPHVDSRSIAFYPSSTGPILIQTDDGGVWQLPLDLSEQGAIAQEGAWWQSLTSEGLSTLEMTMVGWNSHANAIAASFQDNGASLGYFGEPYGTNFAAGDGEVALFDDAQSRKPAKAYLSGQQYLSRQNWQRLVFDDNGFIKHNKSTPFFLQAIDKGEAILPWDETSEVSNIRIFRSPLEANPYQRNNIAMSGGNNIYETVKRPRFVRQQNGLLFRPLLDADVDGLNATAIDYQGDPIQLPVESLYLGAVVASENQRVVLYGRQRSGEATDFQMKPLEFTNLTSDDLTRGGQIQDIAHGLRPDGTERLYWIQGGNNIAAIHQVLGRSTQPSDQILRIATSEGDVTTFNLEQDFGIKALEGDQFGQQALVYTPATKHHSAKLLIGGQQGIWISDLDDTSGFPLGFTKMDWQGLPNEGPGSYINSIHYDPDDDLLIASTLGQGSFLYSFSGNLGKRPPSRNLLHVSNLDLHLSSNPTLDKRGKELNSLIPIALDHRLLDTSKATDLTIKLHDPASWRKAMDVVSLYNINIFNDATADSSQATHGGQQMLADTNLMTRDGVNTFGGKQNKNAITVPLSIAPGASIFNLIVNAKNRDLYGKSKQLKYTVALADGSESLTRRVKLLPLAKRTSPIRTSLEHPDEVTGLQELRPPLFHTALKSDGNMSGRVSVDFQNELDVICGLYWVHNLDGSVLADDGQLIRPGDDGYSAAALRETNLASVFQPDSSIDYLSDTIQLREHGFLAPFANMNGNVVFAFGPDGYDHIHYKSLPDGSVGFEDYASGGLTDYKDIIIRFNPSEFN